MPLHVSSTCVHHQEVTIALHNLWYHHTYRWPSLAQAHGTATYRCDDTKGCVMQFWPPDDECMYSKHVEAWNKLIVKQKFCASGWLITEINIDPYFLTLKSWRCSVILCTPFSNLCVAILDKRSLCSSIKYYMWTPFQRICGPPTIYSLRCNYVLHPKKIFKEPSWRFKM
jgi:hypothetical protein